MSKAPFRRDEIRCKNKQTSASSTPAGPQRRSLQLSMEKKRSLPPKSLLEQGLPVEELYELAKREGNAKKPIYEIHKWWARRLGHVFRSLLIAATTPRMEARPSTRSRQLLKRFYGKNNLGGLTVFDPFMGGGTSVVEALKCGARVIGVDIDPVAWFITKNEVEPFDEKVLREALSTVSKQVEARIRELYQCREPDTGNLVEVVNAFWVARFTCRGCRRTVDAHPHYRLTFRTQHEDQIVFCRECGAVHTCPLGWQSFSCQRCRTRTAILKGTARNGKLRCGHCGTERKIIDFVKKGRPAKKHLFALEYSGKDAKGEVVRRFKAADEFDRGLFRKAKKLLDGESDKLPYPRASIFETGRFDSRPVSHGYAKYEQLFNARQLYCLASIFQEILRLQDAKAREYLLLAFSDCLASNNELVSYAFGYQKATPLFAIHAYQIPQRPVEGNVWGNRHFGRGSFTRCVAKLIAGKRYAMAPFEYRYSKEGEVERIPTGESVATGVVSAANTTLLDQKSRACLLNRSSTDLGSLKARSVDLILTDPPFYNNLPYSELSDFYFQWLRLYFREHRGFSKDLVTPVTETLFVRRKTAEEHQRYLSGITSAMKECARIVKRNGMMVFTFHHKEPAAWHALSASLRATPFQITAIGPIRAEGVSGFHSYSGTPKWDAVICCRLKPRPAPYPVGGSLRPLLAGIGGSEKRWNKRFRKMNLPWNDADRASFAYALALKEIVNRKLDDRDGRRLFVELNKQYQQSRIHATIPKTA